MSDVIVTLSGDEARLFRAQQRIIQQQMEMEAGYTDVEKASRKAAREAEANAKKEEDAFAKRQKQFKDELNQMDVMIVRQKQGNAAATEMRAIQDGYSKEQAKILRSKQEEIDLSKKSVNLMDSSFEKIGQVALGYAGISTAISAIKDSWAEVNELQAKSLELQKGLAPAQADASKNLTGLSTDEKKKAFREVNAIQVETGFADKAKLYEAQGSGYGVSGNIDKTNAMVRAAVPLSMHNPDKLKELVRGSLNLEQATGVSDPTQLLGFQQSAAGIAFVDDNAMVARNMSPLVKNIVQANPEQDRIQAAKESAAMFGEMTKMKSDPTGDTSRVAVDKFSREIANLFKDALKEKDKLDAEIAPLKEKQKVSELETAQISKAEIDVKEAEQKAALLGNRTDIVGQEARADLEVAKARLSKMREDVALSPEEQKKLDKLQSQRDALENLQDPKTFFGRQDVIASNPALKQMALDKLGNDESRGQFEQLLNQNSEAYKSTRKNVGQITFDRSLYDQQVKEDRTLSPEMAIATIDTKAQALDESSTAKFDDSVVAKAKDIVHKALKRNRIKGPMGYADKFISDTFGDGVMAVDAVPALEQSIERMKGQQDDIREMRVTPLDASAKDQIADLEKTIKLLNELKSLRQEVIEGMVKPKRADEVDTKFVPMKSNRANEMDAMDITVPSRARFLNNERQPANRSDSAPPPTPSAPIDNQAAALLQRQNQYMEEQNKLLNQLVANSRPQVASFTPRMHRAQMAQALEEAKHA